MENFAALAQALVAAGGALQSSDESSLARALGDLLRDASARERLVRQARAVLDAHRGATDRTAQLLEKLSAGAG